MNKENIFKAKELYNTQYLLRTLKSMVKSRWFSVNKKKMFEDEWSKIHFNEFDEKTMLELCCIISDYCDKRNAEIDKEFGKM